MSRSGGRRRWVALALVVGAMWALLPFGPRLGAAVLGTRIGAWSAGWGLVVAGVALAATLGARLVRAAPAPATLVLAAVVAAGWGVALSALPGKPVERVHLLEYGVVGALAWRAVRDVVVGEGRALLAAVLLAGLLGWVDELLQRVIPGRYYDVRDVGMNAVGAALGVLTVAVVRATSGRRLSGG